MLIHTVAYFPTDCRYPMRDKLHESTQSAAAGMELMHEAKRLGLGIISPYMIGLPFSTMDEALTWLRQLPQGIGEEGLRDCVAQLVESRRMMRRRSGHSS